MKHLLLHSTVFRLPGTLTTTGLQPYPLDTLEPPNHHPLPSQGRRTHAQRQCRIWILNMSFDTWLSVRDQLYGCADVWPRQSAEKTSSAEAEKIHLRCCGGSWTSVIWAVKVAELKIKVGNQQIFKSFAPWLRLSFRLWEGDCPAFGCCSCRACVSARPAFRS